MRNKFVDRVYDQLQRVDRKPLFQSDHLWATLQKVSNERRIEGVSRRMQALSLPLDPLRFENPPPIGALVVAAPKDFSTLSLVLEGLIMNSRNPITEIALVVPDSAIHEARAAVGSKVKAPVIVTAENDLVSEECRKLLHSTFSHRYGWILQQFLIIAGVVTSSERGIIVVDADTVLTRPRTFLDENYRQILPVSLEHHFPYFQFLGQLKSTYPCSWNSHVTHHMLQQPTVWREILNDVCGGSLQALVDSACAFASPVENSPLCVDYELYAQGLMKLHPRLAIEVKWSNYSRPLSPAEATPTYLELASKYSKYFSVSLHRYQSSGSTLADTNS